MPDALDVHLQRARVGAGDAWVAGSARILGAIPVVVHLGSVVGGICAQRVEGALRCTRKENVWGGGGGGISPASGSSTRWISRGRAGEWSRDMGGMRHEEQGRKGAPLRKEQRRNASSPFPFRVGRSQEGGSQEGDEEGGSVGHCTTATPAQRDKSASLTCYEKRLERLRKAAHGSLCLEARVGGLLRRGHPAGSYRTAPQGRGGVSPGGQPEGLLYI